MAWNRSSRLSVAAAVLIVTLGMLVGIAQAAPGPPRPLGCNQEGRYICISIEDADDVSHSEGAPGLVGAIDRYTEYTVRVSNGGTSALTNGSAKIDLSDLLAGDTVVATQGQFVAAPAGCTPSGPSTSFTCSLPNLGASGVATLHFFARTSTNTPLAAAMRLTVLASFKESASDSEGPASQPDTFSVSERTDLEPNPEFSASIYFDGSQNVVLATAPGAGGQSSVFRVPKTVGFQGSEPVTLTEVSSGGFCSAGFSCFGQGVATSALGIFSAARPANLVTTMNLSLLPPGVGEKSLRVHHTGSTTTSFTTPCGGAVGDTPSVLPCRRVVIDKKAGIVIIDSWDNHQGDWGFS
jgi:hypothetical protein